MLTVRKKDLSKSARSIFAAEAHRWFTAQQCAAPRG
jgi:hypothetical protein